MRDRLRRLLRPNEAERMVASLRLGKGDLAVDCGANVGFVTLALARAGVEVHAFEPHPEARAELTRSTSSYPHVHVHPQAVLDRAGVVRLYLHERAAEDQVRWSQGASLLPHKGNVDPESFVDVDAIDLAAFVLGLDRDVALVKMNIEGAECPIIERLIDSGAMERIRTVLVQLHDRKVPELRAETNRLRERVTREGLDDRIMMDWH